MIYARDLVRNARDHEYRLIHWRRTCMNVKGIKLVLRHPAISPRMFYILCQGYETKEAVLAERYLRADDRVLEVGGGIGFLALTCMIHIGIEDYWLVEGNPALVPIIHKNLELNDIDGSRIGVRNAALAERDGVVTFHVQREFWSSSAIARPGAVAELEVPARTLPSIVAEMPFRPTVLIKDIEGGEGDIDPRDRTRRISAPSTALSP